ncbi:WHG domain-containing protein [Dactylosporangium sp. NPDC000244]|uniref:TetR/AcrR family transcriptional regulator n=1 Tax=Dactylosporangium sp. NPDC000244 TaxID=3154365 RepID=UPI0033337262
MHDDEGLRDRLVRAGVELVAQEGSAAVSLREIARRAGVSHGAPRRHFPTHVGLLSAIARQGFADLTARLRAVPETGSPRDRLGGLAHAYVGFAQENRGMYELMFRHDLLRSDHLGLRETSLPLFETLAALLISVWNDGTASAANRSVAITPAAGWVRSPQRVVANGSSADGADPNADGTRGSAPSAGGVSDAGGSGSAAEGELRPASATAAVGELRAGGELRACAATVASELRAGGELRACAATVADELRAGGEMRPDAAMAAGRELRAGAAVAAGRELRAGAATAAGVLWANLHGIVQLWLWGSLPLATGQTDIAVLVDAALDAHVGGAP